MKGKIAVWKFACYKGNLGKFRLDIVISSEFNFFSNFYPILFKQLLKTEIFEKLEIISKILKNSTLHRFKIATNMRIEESIKTKKLVSKKTIF